LTNWEIHKNGQMRKETPRRVTPDESLERTPWLLPCRRSSPVSWMSRELLPKMGGER
jgi:hypothetical protein